MNCPVRLLTYLCRCYRGYSYLIPLLLNKDEEHILFVTVFVTPFKMVQLAAEIGILDMFF